jgi:hypothetical protein
LPEMDGVRFVAGAPGLGAIFDTPDGERRL